jgi:hypothetical protein
MKNNMFSLDTEQSVIGGLMLDNDQFMNVSQVINENDFYDPQNKLIFKAIKELHKLGSPFDLTTLPTHLKSSGLSQNTEGEIIAYIGELANKTSSAANILHYAKIVKEKSNERFLLNLLTEESNKILKGDNLQEIITNLTYKLENIQHPYYSNEPKFKAVELSEFLDTELPPRELILSPWLPKAGLAMIHARPGVGKTHLSFGIAYAVASGSEFLGWQAEKPRGVLLIDGEMPAPAAQERFSRVVLMNNKDLAAKLLFLTPDMQPLGIMPDLGTKEGQAEVNALITDDIDLVIVDNLSCLVRTGKENDGDSWQPVQSWALSLRAKGKSVLFIHHQGKTGSQRGSSKKEDVLDTVISLKRPDDYIATQGSRFVLTYEKSRGFHGNDAKPFEAHLATNKENNPCWVISDVEASTADKIIAMLNDGMSQKEIAEDLGLNKSTVYRHVQKAKGAGLIKNIGGLKNG